MIHFILILHHNTGIKCAGYPFNLGIFFFLPKASFILECPPPPPRSDSHLDNRDSVPDHPTVTGTITRGKMVPSEIIELDHASIDVCLTLLLPVRDC